MVRFLLNNEPVELQVEDPNTTVLQFLREQRRKTGTKEGCAAGDCGACTVVLATPDETGESLTYMTINSCIAMLSSLHGKQLITVEDLSDGQALHPVQSAMVEHHASQCGFCTPGFVMSTFSLYHNAAAPHRQDAINALSGNLCRCTGYRPIIDAALSACANKSADKFDLQEAETLKRLAALNADEPPATHSSLLMPSTRVALKAAVNRYPDAPLVAGSTDLALEITQKNIRFERLISLSQMHGMNTVSVEQDGLHIGATVPLSRAMKTVIEHYPSLSELFLRFASLPLRNQATLGGNVANASPIGDTPPMLLALDATIVADNGEVVRHIPANEFFVGYRETALSKGEWIDRIILPLPSEGEHIAAYKISKRMEDDISAVMAIFRVTLEDGVVTSVNSGFGGVAATPVSCNELDSALCGKQWGDNDCLITGKNLLLNAFNPIDDVRATAAYRKQVVSNLWHRFWLQTQTENTIETRVVTHA